MTWFKLCPLIKTHSRRVETINKTNTMRTTKTLLTHTHTKRDIYGNVYHAVQVENIKNGKSFTVHTPSLGNVEGILNTAFGGWDKAGIRSVTTCTGLIRISSLPDENAPNLNPCKFTPEWKRELNKIGFRLPRKK